MIPYRDHKSNTLYLQTNTIIPTPGAEDYQISVGNRSGNEIRITRGSYENKTDSVTKFCEKVSDLVMSALPDEVRPDKVSRWSGRSARERYYHFWYLESSKNDPIQWGNWNLSYRIVLTPAQDKSKSGLWNVTVALRDNSALPEDLLDRLREMNVAEKVLVDQRGVRVELDAQVLDEPLVDTTAQLTTRLIENLTPTVREFMKGAE